MEINGHNFTIGADPEIFMSMNGHFVSAHDIIPGSKAEPYKVQNGAVQVDGMALEFNIDPATDLEEFSNNLDIVQKQLLEMLPKGSNILSNSTVEFDKEFYKKVPVPNRRLGCEPDYNAYTLKPNKKPSQKALMRTAGGHIHIGGFFSGSPTESGHLQSGARLARILDDTLGKYSILWDKDDLRRKLYGAAGAFRPKTYGMEYRSLSNAWIFSPALVSFVYEGVVEALEKMFDFSFEPDPEIRNILDNSLRDHPLLNDSKGKFLRRYFA